MQGMQTIAKQELRIGKLVAYKTEHIRYFHVDCAFKSFRRARMVTNVIYHKSELDGFDLIKNEDKSLLKQTIEIENATRKLLPLKTNSEKNRVETPTLLRKTQLKPINVAAINVIFTNSDQLTATKMFELKNRIIREKTCIIVVCEVKTQEWQRKNFRTTKSRAFQYTL